MGTEEMDYETVRGTARQVDIIVGMMLEADWEIISETDSRTTYRKFSGGKAIGGAALLGPVGLLAGAIGKNKKSGEVMVRLQRPKRIGIAEKAALEKRKAEEKARKQAKKDAWKKKSAGEKLDHAAQNNLLAKTPLTTFYWYKKFKNRKNKTS